MTGPTWLRPDDLIVIELVGGGHRDGARASVPAYHLDAGWLTPERDRPTCDRPTCDVESPCYRQQAWRWDGGTTEDGAYRFRPA